MAVKKCRVCGKEYEPCRTADRLKAFHWKEMTCCPEHGAIYLADIMKGRSRTQLDADKKQKVKTEAELVEDVESEQKVETEAETEVDESAEDAEETE